jgi:hypothetical protein
MWRTYLFTMPALLLMLAACAGPTASLPAATAPAPATAAPTSTPAPALAGLDALPQGKTAAGYQRLGDPNAPLTLTMYSDFL